MSTKQCSKTNVDLSRQSTKVDEQRRQCMKRKCTGVAMATKRCERSDSEEDVTIVEPGARADASEDGDTLSSLSEVDSDDEE
ncbi:hypothetical protein PsorP6_010949 [Peronosclerospora sorghi]|uniref:Uncharacterized protein n=1 Tax=Peronosclerospora sorghi TaxID=230839 RepID=A0ACC0VWQ2_9STRA|nr:hypothetical protein PsorP6_010949 [Peronosclerospora sorghi]